MPLPAIWEDRLGGGYFTEISRRMAERQCCYSCDRHARFGCGCHVSAAGRIRHSFGAVNRVPAVLVSTAPPAVFDAPGGRLRFKKTTEGAPWCMHTTARIRALPLPGL